MFCRFTAIDLRGGCEGDLCFSALKENNYTGESGQFSRKEKDHSHSEPMQYKEHLLKLYLPLNSRFSLQPGEQTASKIKPRSAEVGLWWARVPEAGVIRGGSCGLLLSVVRFCAGLGILGKCAPSAGDNDTILTSSLREQHFWQGPQTLVIGGVGLGSLGVKTRSHSRHEILLF